MGIPPEAELMQGPVLASAFRLHPPEDSVQFALSLAGLQDGRLVHPGRVSKGESTSLQSLLPKLTSKSWTPVWGEGLQHVLVSEDGSLDVACIAIGSAYGKFPSQCLPQGDGEGNLRRLIDDSINLLMEQEFNHIRRQEGLPELGPFWPWGPGWTPKLQNFPLAFRSPVEFYSSSLTIQGIARLAGCTARRMEVGFKSDWKSLVPTTPSIHHYICGDFERARESHQLDRAERLLHEIQLDWFEPLRSKPKDEPVQVAILSPNRENSGLAALWSNLETLPGRVPFHESAVGDDSLERYHAWEFVRHCWQSRLASA